MLGQIKLLVKSVESSGNCKSGGNLPSQIRGKRQIKISLRKDMENGFNLDDRDSFQACRSLSYWGNSGEKDFYSKYSSPSLIDRR